MHHLLVAAVLAFLDCHAWEDGVRRSRAGDVVAQREMVRALRDESWPVCEGLFLPGALSSSNDWWAKDALRDMALNGKNAAYASEALIAWWRLRTPEEDIAWIRALKSSKVVLVRKAALGLLLTIGDKEAEAERKKEAELACANARFGLVMGLGREILLLSDPSPPPRVDLVCAKSAAQEAGFRIGDVLLAVDEQACDGIVSCQLLVSRAFGQSRAFVVTVLAESGKRETRSVSK